MQEPTMADISSHRIQSRGSTIFVDLRASAYGRYVKLKRGNSADSKQQIIVDERELPDLVAMLNEYVNHLKANPIRTRDLP
jgi:hypothetical protein